MISVQLSRFRRLQNWLRSLFHWLFDARIFWLAICVAAGALVFVVRKGVTEPEIRLTGLALQLLGIATVAYGIRETRVLFGRPDLFTVAKKWLERVPVYGGRVVSASANLMGSGATLHGRAYVSTTAPPNASVEDRVSVLERNIQNLNRRIDETQTEMDQSLRAQSIALEEERQQRSSENRLISTKLEATETGGLHISAMGVLWLFIGVTLSTASVELVVWFK